MLLTRATQRSQGAITSQKLRSACEKGCKRIIIDWSTSSGPREAGWRGAAWPEEMGGEEGIGGRRTEEMGLWLLAVW